LLDGEMPAAALQERLASIVKSNGQTPLKPFNIFTPDLQAKDRPAFNIGNAIDQEALEPYLEGIDLIIVDNIATLCRTGKENDAESWAPIQAWGLRQRAAGRSVMFIHHSGKGGQQRGTSSREDVLDTVVSLRRPSDYEPDQGARFEVYFEKSRGFFGDDSQPIEAALVTNANGLLTWSVKSLEECILDRVIELHREGLKQHEIAEEVQRHKSNVSRMIRKAKKEGLINEY